MDLLGFFKKAGIRQVRQYHQYGGVEALCFQSGKLYGDQRVADLDEITAFDMAFKMTAA